MLERVELKKMREVETTPVNVWQTSATPVLDKREVLALIPWKQLVLSTAINHYIIWIESAWYQHRGVQFAKSKEPVLQWKRMVRNWEPRPRAQSWVKEGITPCSCVPGTGENTQALELWWELEKPVITLTNLKESIINLFDWISYSFQIRISISLHLYLKSHRSLSREVCINSPCGNIFCFPWVKHHMGRYHPQILAPLAAKTLVKILRDGIALLCLETGGRK